MGQCRDEIFICVFWLDLVIFVIILSKGHFMNHIMTILFSLILRNLSCWIAEIHRSQS